MRVLVIGSGAREHAIVKALRGDARVTALYALPGNAGMAEAVCLPGDPMDNAAVVRQAQAQRIDFCVVTPDDPLANGLVDALEDAGIACFGPTRAAAQIEASKVFAKGLMNKYGIPTAGFAVAHSFEEGMQALRGMPCPVVVKADGLAKGKGVLIAQTQAEAEAALRSVFCDKAFGEAGSRAVMEEFLTGPEVSVLVLTDGEALVPMPSAMDHKRALDGDMGLNTGGMGAIAPNPCYTADMAKRCMDEVFIPTVRAMEAEGTPFRGCLFFGLMLTPQGPKVLEYNARFGDPETQVVFTLLQNSPLDAFLHCRNGGLQADDLQFDTGSACCVVLASGGYPGAFKSGFAIAQQPHDGTVYYAGVRREGGQLVTAGGRVLSVCAAGATLQEAVDAAYRAAGHIHFDGAHMRTDIGQRALRGEGMA